MQKQNKAKFRSFTKRLQCILSAMLMLLMTFTTVPIEAFAEDDENNIVMYGLRIAGVRVTEENASDILGNKVFSYDNSTKTLTVNGDYNYDGTLGIIQTIGSELNIYVASDSHLTMLPGSGALSINHDTTITGPGVLTVESKLTAIYLFKADLTISDAIVNVICRSSDPSNAIDVQSGTFSIVNSDFNVTCTDKAYAIKCDNGKINLEGCNIVDPQGGEVQSDTIVDSTGNSVSNVKISANMLGVEYSVIPNSKAIKKDCYDDPDYSAGINGTLKFSAARNERESGQMILKSDVDINNITIEMSDLVGPDGNTISQNNVEIFFERYIYEDNKSHESITDTQGYYGDALLPYNLAVDLNNNNMSVENGKNQGIWFTLNVLTDQKEGTYKGNYRVKYKGGSFIVPVEAEVYNFTLPHQTYSRTRFNIFSSSVKDALINMAGFDEGKSHDYKLAVNDLLDARKMSSGYPNTSIPWRISKFDWKGESGSLNDLNDYAEGVYKYVTNSKAPYYGLDFSVYSEERTKIFDDNIDISGEYIDNLKNNAVLDELINNGESQTLSTIISNKKKDIIKSLENLYCKPLTEEMIEYIDEKYSYTPSESEKKDILAALDNFYGISLSNDKKPKITKILDELCRKRLLKDYNNTLNSMDKIYDTTLSEETKKELLGFLCDKYSRTPSEDEKVEMLGLLNDFYKKTLSEDNNAQIIEFLNELSSITTEDEEIAKMNDFFSDFYCDPLSDDELEAVDFAVDIYLYFDLKYYTGSLTEKDMDFINPDLVNRYYDSTTGIKGYLVKIRNLNTEKRTEELEALKTKIKGKKINVYRLYDGLILSESYLKNDSDAGRKLARKLKSLSNLSQYDFIGTGGDRDRVFFGTQSVMKSLVDKSFENKTDLLKYAFYRCDIDEPATYDYWRNYKIIVCNKVMDDTKKAIIEYINTNYANDPMSAQLINSVDNIAFISTMTAIDNEQCTFKSNTFLMDNVVNYSSMVYKGIGIFFNEQINEEMPIKVYKDGFVKIKTDGNGTEKRYKNEAEIYTVEIPINYTVKSYCPLFNDLSTHTEGAHFAKDLEATTEALNDPNIHMWWYSCSSTGHPSLAGHYLGGNINTDINNPKLNMNGNSLAIDRANQWQQFKLGIEGELYWAVDDYGDEDDNYGYNVWKITNGFCNEGILIYPIYQYLTASLGISADAAKEKCNEYGYFASSVRLENLSEGKDDYDYLFLAYKLIKEAELIGEDVTPYIERINRRYDSLFSSANYTESTTSEKISYAKQTLAEIISSLQYITRTKGIVFDIESGGKSEMVIRFDKEYDQHHYSDPIYLNFENETATVGTLVKYANEDKYEYIAFLDDLPMTAEPLNDPDDHHLCLKEITDYSFNDDGSITENVTCHTNIKFSSVDLVKPIKQFSYEKTTFWNKVLDEEFSDWKNSDAKLVLQVKAVDITDEKNDEQNNKNHTASIYFTPASSSEVLTKMFAIDFTDPKNPTTEIGTIEPNDCGWFTLTIPLKELTAQKSDSINKPIGKIAARDIGHSFAIKIVDSSTSEPPTGIKPVNRTVWGDANCDGGVDLSDAILIMQSIANPNKYGLGGTAQTAITEKGKLQADVDTSVKGVTGNDAVMIQKYLLKIIKSLEPSE